MAFKIESFMENGEMPMGITNGKITQRRTFGGLIDGRYFHTVCLRPTRRTYYINYAARGLIEPTSRNGL